MKKIKVCLAVLVIAMITSSSALSFNKADHIKVAPNGIGDLLIFPWYSAFGNEYDTKITVINTSNTYSVVAKVVYRTFGWSQEVKDHLIYLSPNDVWTGVVYLDGATNKTRLWSSDDSILVSAGVFASPAVPVNEEFKAAEFTGDSNTFGYIEVIEAAAKVIPKSNGKVTKAEIYSWYTPLTSADIAQTYKPVNVLTGYQENFIGNGQTLKQAEVFADYRNKNALTIAAATVLGQNANNTLTEIEAAMSKYDVVLPYVAKSTGDKAIHIFNFPTKMSWAYSTKPNTYRYNLESPYFEDVYYQCNYYTLEIYDLMENTPAATAPPVFSPVPDKPGLAMCYEVEWITRGYVDQSSFTEGWLRYNWKDAYNMMYEQDIKKYGENGGGTLMSYKGTPVLPSVLYWTDSGANWANAAAGFSVGDVYDEIAGSKLPYYQYTNNP